jgi:type I restriction enzyme, S subunit
MISGKYLFDEGDVLYSKIRPYLRKVVVAPFRGLCSADMYPLTVRADVVDNHFLAWLLVSDQFTAFANRESGRARMPKLNRQQLLSWVALLPPLREQHRIVRAMSQGMRAVERAQAAAAARRAAVEALAASELRGAFKGFLPLSSEQTQRPPPSGWKWRLLTSMARLETGHTPSRNQPDWWGGDIPWISLSDIRELDGRIATDTREWTNPEGIANSAARVLPAGTVVLSRTASVGFVTVMGREMATSQDFVNWVCGPELDPQFLAYVLRSSRGYIRSLSSGAIHQTVYMPTVEALSVCAPSLDEQKRIVAELGQRLDSATRLQSVVELELAAIEALPAALLRRTFSEGF